MDRLDLNTPSNINGLLFGVDGKITAFTICTNKMMQVICHGLSDHFVTTKGGFHAGTNTFATKGVAIGKGAISDENNTGIDSIQLGSGINNDEKSLKVYDFKLLNSDGKIPTDRLPNLTIEMEIIDNILSWRYVGDTVWTALLDVNNLNGEDGQSFQVNEYGNLNEAKLVEIANNITTGRYLFLVNPSGDIRADNTTPVSLNGDMSRHILMYDGDSQEWFDYGEFTGLQGDPGIPIELQNNGTYIQWKYTTDATWTNLITLANLKGDKGDKGEDGANGLNLELDGTDVNYIRWRVVGDSTWINLVNKSTITGPKGTSGDDGRDVEFRVYSNRWLQWRYVGEIVWNNSYDLNLLSIVDNNWTLVEGILSPTVPTTRIRTSVIAADDNDVVNKKYVDDKKLTTNITTAEDITPTGNALENELFVTALLEAASFNAPSGTPINGNTLLFRIYSASTQTLTWDAIYYGFIGALPTTTLAGKEMYLAFIYNGRTSKWDYVGKTVEA